METLLDLPYVTMVLTVTMHKYTSLSVGTLTLFNWWRSQMAICGSLVCVVICPCMYRMYISHLIFYISILDCKMTMIQ